MSNDKTEKWYHLYSNNRSVYPPQADHADGYVHDNWGEDDMGDSLNEIAEAADEVTDDYKYDTSKVHVWRDSSDQRYNFKMPDSYWEEQKKRESETDDNNDDYQKPRLAVPLEK
jgi:hypothetical protein